MNISFLNPSFLFALPLVAIPVLIHLLTRKKFKPLPFSETRFIEAALEKTVKRHKLRQYLLLFLRCLILLFLTLLFARPVIQSSAIFTKAKEEGMHLVFLLDNSYSLGYVEEGQRRFELVKEAGKNLISKLSNFDSVLLCAFSNRVNLLTNNFVNEKKTCFEVIDKISLSNHPTDLSPALKESYRLLSNIRRANKIIVVISDFARNGWQKVNLEKMGIFDSQVKIILINVVKGKSKNQVVEEILFRDILANKPVVMETKIANYSPEKIAQLPIQIGEDGKQLASGFLEILPDEKKSKQFVINLTQSPDRMHPGYVRLGGDNLTIDDIRYFVFALPEPIKILAVDGSPGLAPVNSELYYFRLALNPYREKGAIFVDTAQEKEWETLSLGSYSLIVFANLEKISSSGTEKLKDYLEDGGNIFFALGDKINLQHYNQELNFLLPGELKKINREKAKITILNFEHSVLKIFDTQEVDFSGIVFPQYYLIEPKPGAQRLLGFAQDAPLILEITPFPGGGKVLLFASSLDRDWTNFPAKPLYPALFQEIIRYLAGKEKGIFSFTLGEKISLPFLEKPKEFRIENSELRIKNFEVSWEEESGFRGYEIRGNLEPGVYPFSYRIKGKRENGYLVVNLDIASGESDLRMITSSEIKKLFPHSPVAEFSVKENYPEKFIQFLKGKEITQNLIIATFLFLFLEGFAANRFFIKRKKEQ